MKKIDPSAVSYPDVGNDWCFSVEDTSFWFAHRNNCILEAVKRFPPQGVFLDIGGGNGFVSLALHKAGWDVCLVEPGRSGAVNAKKRGIPTIINASVDQAGLRPTSAGAIGLFDVLEHIEDDHGFLVKMRGTLAPGGHLFLTVPAYRFLWSEEDNFAGHFRRYSPASISTQLQKSGFKVRYLTPIFSILPLPMFLFRVLPEKIGLGKPVDLEKERKRHLMPQGVVGSLLNKIWRYEIARIKTGRTLPTGASLLVVAQVSNLS